MGDGREQDRSVSRVERDWSTVGVSPSASTVFLVSVTALESCFERAMLDAAASSNIADACVFVCHGVSPVMASSLLTNLTIGCVSSLVKLFFPDVYFFCWAPGNRGRMVIA